MRFDVIIAPNSFVKSKKGEERKIDEAIGAIREAFWSAFDEALAGEPSLADCRQRYGGRLGFKWIMLPVNSKWQSEDEPFCWLGIINASSSGRQRVGIKLFCPDSARADARERLELTKDRLQNQGIPLGEFPADLSSKTSMHAAVIELLEKAKAVYHQLRRTFNDTSPEPISGQAAN